MKVLLTGCTGYIGKRLLRVLDQDGVEIICFARNVGRLPLAKDSPGNHKRFEVDLLKPVPAELSELDFDVAFYLIHSMSSSIGSFMDEEERSARNFSEFVSGTQCKQIIYLSGISNSPKLSKHLQSRRNVEDVLRSSGKPLTVLRAGIIVGSGSASFEIIRDLMEKMPVMLVPLWVKTLCQPVAVSDVMKYITGCMLNEETFDQVFDIGGKEILSYKSMLMQYAEVRNLKRRMYVVSFVSPRLSSYWLYFVTSTSYKLAVNLVDSMKVEVICKDNRLQEMLEIKPLTYKEACRQALERINLDAVASSWTDAIHFRKGEGRLFDYLEVPEFGILKDTRRVKITGDPEEVANKFFSIGGNNGWYYADWIWEARGVIDKMVGGVGLRRGRRNSTSLIPGDALDFWRVLIADKENFRLLLFAEMKVPGEAWLDFSIVRKADGFWFVQKATFMPRGLSGRLYWYLLLPIHIMVFKGMSHSIGNAKPRGK